MQSPISRRDAHLQGLKRFYTGEPCKRGHVCERFTSNGNCVRCMVFTTPNRKTGAKGNNVGWPAVGLVFTVPDVLPEEMEAAFRMIEAMHWHDHCVLEMRKDPTLLEKYRTKLRPEEVGMLEAQLVRAKRTASGGVMDAILTLACGFGQHYYGPRLAVGDSIECDHCNTQQVIERVDR
jgi:hypothetical protein